MDSLLANYTEKANFWKLYPTWKMPKLYKEFYNSDKSKNKKDSNKIMWALVFMFDKTSDNPYKLLQMEDRIEVINEDIIDDIQFNWDKYEELVNFTRAIFMTEVERTYYSLLTKMGQRRKIIEDSKYSLESAPSIDAMIKNTIIIRTEIDNLKRIVEQQETGGRTKGDITLSAGEKREI